MFVFEFEDAAATLTSLANTGNEKVGAKNRFLRDYFEVKKPVDPYDYKLRLKFFRSFANLPRVVTERRNEVRCIRPQKSHRNLVSMLSYNKI